MSLQFIGNQIKKYRKEKGITQKQLGELLGKTESSIQKYEAGKTDISINVLFDLSAVLDVDLYDLIDNEILLKELNEHDEALFKYAAALGYRFSFPNNNDNTFCILHNGYKYKIPNSELLKILGDVKTYSEYTLHKLLEKYDSKKG